MTDKQNLTDKPETTTPEVSTVEALTKQTEALKELTTQVAKLCAEWEKWRKAGKF